MFLLAIEIKYTIVQYDNGLFILAAPLLK